MASTMRWRERGTDPAAHARRRSIAAAIGVAMALTGFGGSAAAIDLVVETDTTLSPGTYQVDALIVRSGATLLLQSDLASGAGVTIEATSLLVEANGAISADGQGHGPGAGPGAGGPGGYAIGGGGGGHAGFGGRGSGGGAAGAAYGEPLSQGAVGSGGGSAGSSDVPGSGGGSITLLIDGIATVDGAIRANGTSASGGTSLRQAGGGSGGTVSLRADALDGSGVISADGGAGGSSGSTRGGGGSGGRVFIQAIVLGAPTVRALPGGSTHERGAAGMLLDRPPGAPAAAWTLRVEGDAPAQSDTVISGDAEFAHVELSLASLRMQGLLSCETLHLADGASVRGRATITCMNRGRRCAPASGPGEPQAGPLSF